MKAFFEKARGETLMSSEETIKLMMAPKAKRKQMLYLQVLYVSMNKLLFKRKKKKKLAF